MKLNPLKKLKKFKFTIKKDLNLEGIKKIASEPFLKTKISLNKVYDNYKHLKKKEEEKKLKEEKKAQKKQLINEIKQKKKRIRCNKRREKKN